MKMSVLGNKCHIGKYKLENLENILIPKLAYSLAVPEQDYDVTKNTSF